MATAAAERAINAAMTSPDRERLDSANGMRDPPGCPRMPDPESGERQSRAGIDGSRRHPHDDSGKLLVLERRQSPARRSRGLGVIDNARRERHESAQHARM